MRRGSRRKKNMVHRNFWFAPIAAILFVIAPDAAAQGKYLAANVKPSSASDLRHIKDVNDAYQADLMYANSRYRVGASDVISLRFPRAPEFNQAVSVEPDGSVNLAGVGDVRIAGLTTPELTEAVQLAYAKILPDPTVIVELKDFSKPYFLVLGEVNRPGRYDMQGYTSAIEAVASAGGLRNSAKYSQVLLFRRASHEWYEVKPLDLRQFLRGRDLEEDAEVRPGDMVFVPQNLRAKFKRLVP